MHPAFKSCPIIRAQQDYANPSLETGLHAVAIGSASGPLVPEGIGKRGSKKIFQFTCSILAVGTLFCDPELNVVVGGRPKSITAADIWLGILAGSPFEPGPLPPKKHRRETALRGWEVLRKPLFELGNLRFKRELGMLEHFASIPNPDAVHRLWDILPIAVEGGCRLNGTLPDLRLDDEAVAAQLAALRATPAMDFVLLDQRPLAA